MQGTLGSAAESSVLCTDLSCKELVFKSLFFRMKGKKEKKKVLYNLQSCDFAYGIFALQTFIHVVLEKYANASLLRLAGRQILASWLLP